MRRLRVTVLDLTTERPTRALYARLINANLASIMPQVIAVWCEQLGHTVSYISYTGFEDLASEVFVPADVVFVCAFTQAAHLAYAISHRHRQLGAVTVLGGPHARCYPEDAQRYFDYVLGFTRMDTVDEVLREAAPHRPLGRRLCAERQPPTLPGVRERWKFVETNLRKSPLFQIVPMIGSLGCPYTCNFCIDSTVPYQPLDFTELRDDLRFLVTKMRKPTIGWHDPNFGVRFDDFLGAMEEAVPPGRIESLAEMSLSLLSEPHLERLRKNGFKALLPGIESWFALGAKSKTGRASGMAKVEQVSAHVRTILRYVPYVQTNFVLGLDSDEGPEPFELTKRFVELTPGIFPAFSLLSAFGRAAPLNLEFQRAGRVLPLPFHFLDANTGMNVRPKNYEWPEFYDRVLDLERHTFALPRLLRHLPPKGGILPRWFNVLRGISSERLGRMRNHVRVRASLADAGVRRFFDGQASDVPALYEQRIRRDLGPLWTHLPAGGVTHDPNAYLKSESEQLVRLA